MTSYIKWMDESFTDAPVISNNFGDLTNALDKILVTGFNQQTITSITRSGSTITVTTSAPHGFVVKQIVVVSGADQSEYNDEFKILSITPSSFTATVSGTPVTPATGTMTVKIAPLGYEILYTGTNKRAYRSLDPTSTKPILRVDDSLDPVWTSTYSKYGKVTLAESMSDVDTFLGKRAPYDPALPTKNEIGTGSGSSAINGWYKWPYARSGSATDGDDGAYNRKWKIVGDSKTFYLFLQSGFLGSGTDSGGMPMFVFGEFNSFKPSDIYNWVLTAEDRYYPANNGTGSSPDERTASSTLQNSTGKLLLTDSSGMGLPIPYRMASLGFSETSHVFKSGEATVPYPNQADGSLLTHPIYIKESSVGSKGIRGAMRGIICLFQTPPFGDGSFVSEVVGDPDKEFLCRGISATGTNFDSYFLFDMTGPW